MARAAALRGGSRNGDAPQHVTVSFPDAFAATRVVVGVRGDTAVALPGARRRSRVEVRARAAAEIMPDLGATLGMPTHGSGGGYSGPLAYRQGKPMRPDVAAAFDRMAATARSEAGLSLLVTSGYRSDAEHAKLFAAQPSPHLLPRLWSRSPEVRSSL